MWAGGWTDRPCHVAKCCVCESAEQPYLQLRGLCRHSALDGRYVPHNPGHSGRLTYAGLYGTTIQYEDASLAWVASVHRDGDTVTRAYTRAPKVRCDDHELLLSSLSRGRSLCCWARTSGGCTTTRGSAP